MPYGRKYLTILTGLLLILALAVPAYATTLSEVLEGVKNVRKPSTLTSISFLGSMTLDLSPDAPGLLPEGASLIAAWKSPDEWFSTYELTGELASGASGLGLGHPAVDHVALSRPDILDLLLIDWDVQYQGTAMWEGEPAWALVFETKDRTLDIPAFTLYVRKDDFYPLRTKVEFPDGSVGITDFTWVVVDSVTVPATFLTVFDPPVGPLNGYSTTYFNHEINPDLSGIDFPREQGSLLSSNDPDVEDGPAVFEELYHGFADNPIETPITDSSGTWTSLSFTFSLYVEERALVGILNDNIPEIRDLAIGIVSGWDWSGDDGLGTPGGKYECGNEIRDAINEFLQTTSITDFYFLDFEPS